MNSLFPIKAKKSLGQHFLTSKHVLDQIIEAAEIKEAEKILEIGPGTGVLTTELLKTGAKIVAIEKDSRSIQLLKEKFHQEISRGQLVLVEGDILDTKVSELNLDEYLIVANIPYYITGAILEKFLGNEPRPNRMILLTQKEVADRIVAKNNKESLLSVSVKVFGQPNLIAKVPAGAFNPPPKVNSAILAIKNIGAGAFNQKKLNIKAFFVILKAGFAHKRKFLKNNLEAVIAKDKLELIWNKLLLDPKVRAEDLDIESWFAIAESA